MSLEKFEKRIADIKAAIEQSAANHNGLLGRLSEAQHCLDLFLGASAADAKVVEEISAE